ncbi:MAG: MFS transporter [Dehalococcoidia bacterium]
MSVAARLARPVRDFALLRAYWGYYVVVALFVAEFAVTGISLYSFSLYIRTWLNDPSLPQATAAPSFAFSWNPLALAAELWRFAGALATNWSLTAINFSYTVTLPTAFLSTVIGAFIDRRGTRLAMLVGVPMVAVSLFLQAFMTYVWHLWVVQFLLALGQSAAFLGAAVLIGRWFVRNRGLIMGITLAGNNAGGIVMAPVSAHLIEAVGWRTMFVLYGVTLFVVNLALIWLFVRDRPEEVAAAARRAGRPEELAAAEAMLADQATRRMGRRRLNQPGDWSVGAAVRTRAFWFITLALLSYSVSVFAVLNQVGNHLKIVGINLTAAGTAIGLLGLFGLIGKVTFGWASQRWRPRYVCGAVCAPGGRHPRADAGDLARAGVGTVPFAICYGLGFGAMAAVQQLVIIDSFGFVSFATILGVVQVFQRLGGALTPTLTGLSVDATQSYRQVFWVTIVLLAARHGAGVAGPSPSPDGAETAAPAAVKATTEDRQRRRRGPPAYRTTRRGGSRQRPTPELGEWGGRRRRLPYAVVADSSLYVPYCGSPIMT